jgi:hypothetical protein
MSMMKIRKALQPSRMEILKIVEHNHQQCKLNDEHNKAQSTQTQQWILECQQTQQQKPKHKLRCFTWIPSPKHDDAMKIKAYKTFMHWFKMRQCAMRELRAHLNNNVVDTN